MKDVYIRNTPYDHVCITLSTFRNPDTKEVSPYLSLERGFDEPTFSTKFDDEAARQMRDWLDAWLSR